MKKQLAIFITLFSSFVAQSQNWEWTKYTKADSSKCEINDLLCLSSNRQIIAGSFDNVLSFHSSTGLSVAGSNDGFWALQGVSSNYIKSISGNGISSVKAIASSGSSNLLLTGNFTGTATFSQTISLTSNGLNDAFIASCNLNTGAVNWVYQIGGPGNAYGLDVCANSSSIYVSGRFDDSLFISNDTLVSFGQNDGFIIQLSPSGNVLWNYQFGGTGDDCINSIDISSSGSIAGCGYFSGTLLNPNSGTVNNGNADGFVIKFSNTNQFSWIRGVGGVLDDELKSITINTSRIFCGGYFSDTITWNMSNTSVSNGATDCLVASFDTSGNWLWANAHGGIGQDRINAIAENTIGSSLYVAGTFFDTLHIGNTQVPSAGSSDAYVAGFSATGQYNWIYHPRGLSVDKALAINCENGLRVGIQYTDSIKHTTSNAQTFTNGTGGLSVTVSEFTGQFSSLTNNARPFSYSVRRSHAVGSNRIIQYGQFLGTVAIGNVTITSPNSAGLVTVIDTNGNYIAHTKFMATGSTSGGQYGILDVDFFSCVDQFGSIYISGYYNGTVDFGNNVIVNHHNNLFTGNQNEGFVVKLDSNGVAQWAKSFYSSGNGQTVHLRGLSVSKQGFLYTTVYASSSLVYGDYCCLHQIDAATGNVITTYNVGNGTYVNLCNDVDGNVYLAGSYYSQSAPFNLPSDNNPVPDLYLAKLTPSLSLVWAKPIFNIQPNYKMVSDTVNHKIYFNYLMNGTYFIVDGDTTFMTGGSPETGIIAADTSGNFLWVKHFYTTTTGFAYLTISGMELDDDYNVVTTISPFINVTSFTVDNRTFTVNSSNEFYIMKFNRLSGHMNTLYSNLANQGTTTDAAPDGIVTSSTGKIYVSGCISSGKFLIGSTVVLNQYAGSQSPAVSFWAKFDNVCPSADFNSTDTSGLFSFQNFSSNATWWHWDFGDGDTSNLEHPTHFYQNSGVYNVCLMTGNSCGIDTVCKPISFLILGQDYLKTNDFEIYPNPSSSYITLKQNQLSGKSDYTFRILTYSGQTYFEKQSCRQEEFIPVDNLSNGIYFLLLYDNEMKYIGKKAFVVSR